MKICIAQTKSVKGDIAINIKTHLKCIELATSNGADVIFFPELSLTGYEPGLAAQLKTNQADARFSVFQNWSNEHGVLIGIGVPTACGDGVCISLVIFQPDSEPAVYSKQYLHEDEEPYFVQGKKDLLISFKGENIAPAICYESLLPHHSGKAFNAGAQVYLASVAKPTAGVQKALHHFPEVAKQYHMPVLMANCVGYCDNFESVGNSSVWNIKGELLAQLDHSHEGFIVFNTQTDEILIKHLP